MVPLIGGTRVPCCPYSSPSYRPLLRLMMAART